MQNAKLNPKQRIFVHEYLTYLNATEAAKRAGYSPKTAYAQGQALLKHPEIKEAVEKGIAAAERRTHISVDYVLDGIRECIERCLQRSPVLDSEGNPTGEWRFDAKGALKGFELLGRHLAMFTDKVEQVKPIEVVVRHIGVDHIPYGPDTDRADREAVH